MTLSRVAGVLWPPSGAYEAPGEVWIEAGCCRLAIPVELNAWRVLRGLSYEITQLRKVVAASRLSKLLAAHLCFVLF
jgi:hypothetical protein